MEEKVDKISFGLFYTFVTYLEDINKRLEKYKDQPVRFYVDGRGTFVIVDIKSDMLNNAVCLEAIEADENEAEVPTITDTIVLTLTDLIEKFNVIKEDCFDYVPVLIKYKEDRERYIPSPENTIPIFATKVGITEDEKKYAFIVDTID